MKNDCDNLRFRCAFSRKGIKNNKKTCVVLIILAIVFSGYSIVYLEDAWIGILISLFLIIMSVYSMTYVCRLTKQSYLEITTEGILNCVYKGRGIVRYPIKEIISIEEATIEQANKKHAVSPLNLNQWKWGLYPPEGVLITFSRAYIKSIFPIYLNPADISGFISALNQRLP